ncbi:hypothetical protein D3C81_2169870 [compost metagenome]
MQRIAVAVADQPSCDLHTWHLLANILQCIESLGVTTAYQKAHTLAYVIVRR